jgi:signal transduction histidine kinase
MSRLGHGSKNSWTLGLAVVGVVVLFFLTFVIAKYWAQQARRDINDTVANALLSVDQVSRMGRDIDQERILLDIHIFESEQATLNLVDAQITQARGDFAAADRIFATVATLPGEEAASQDLRRRLAAIRGPVDEVLALSRSNRDNEAREKLSRLEPGFMAVDADLDRLIRINRTAANHALEHMEAVQESSANKITGLALVGTVLTMLLGVGATRSTRRREKQLTEYSAKLAAQNRELDAFAGRVAHDLRGPLTAISLSAATLSRAAPSQEGTSATLRRGVLRMERLIDDLLALSRVGAEGTSGSSDPAQVVAQVAEDLAPRVELEGGTLRLAVKPARVRASEGLLAQALSNLTDNALKYRRPEAPPEIEVNGRSHEGGYELSVRDNGLGMSPDELRQAFQPFYRALRARAAPGTGLGLSIVKRVLEANGGSVRVESQLGRGTTFVLELPLADGAG